LLTVQRERATRRSFPSISTDPIPVAIEQVGERRTVNSRETLFSALVYLNWLDLARRLLGGVAPLICRDYRLVA
jgi:hypothetical protein